MKGDNFDLDIKEREDEDEIEIKDFLKCPICMENLKSPRMCLTCKKSICYQCLKQYYNTGGKQCPLCKTYYKFENFVPFANFDYIQKFFIKHENEKKQKKMLSSSLINQSNLKINDKDIDNYYDSNLKTMVDINILTNSSEICPKHHYKYIFYCLDCKIKLCGLCSSNLNSKTNKKKNNIHKEHNVFKIKDIEKYGIKELFQSYKNISNKINLINENIKKINKNINNFRPYENIFNNQINLLSEKIKYNSSQLVKNVENIKNNILKENDNNNELLNINNYLKEIIKNKKLEGYKDLMNKIKIYSKKNEDKKYSEVFNIDALNKISYVIHRSDEIILEKIKENKDNPLINDSIYINNYEIFYIIEKIDVNNIRFQISFEIQNEFAKKKFIVSILIKNPKSKEYQIINLFAKHENTELFLFDAIYSSEKFYNLINKEENIEINIILSELKN